MVCSKSINPAQRHKDREESDLVTFVEVGNCCSSVLKWHPQWQGLLMAYSICERERKICLVSIHADIISKQEALLYGYTKTSERHNSLVIIGSRWRSFSFAILSCIYNCRDRVWHKNNCQPALDGQLGSSLFSKKEPTHQLNCPLSSKVAKPCQTNMSNMDRLNTSSSVDLDRNWMTEN